ncbi:hypothetical protein [Nocardioides albus]|uniref:Peptidase MA-like domain-containing protein n=1 Tax=Nocardioides albus TaxID=1841 RepID=A0A7W5A1V5_9ACTN|nr:hypothetical protein [Nocardioides albus]MBB3087951.1 hypothetical protein [Nocardioides albus]GGU21537.1 hypothetical protein GCM10007979_20180 [Nocardioides albus]
MSVFIGVLASGLALATASPVAAAPGDGLAASSNARYVVDVKAREVRASIDLTITNQQPDQGNTRYYYNSYWIYVPAKATKIRASSHGATLPVSLEPVPNGPGSFARVGFSGLYYGQTRTISWDYTMPAAPIRSKKSNVRVGDGYAVFEAVGIGDDTTVEVVGPPAMELDASDGVFIQKETGKSVTWTASDVEFAGVSLRDREKNIERTVSIGGTDVVVQAFPGDEAWLDFAERNIAEAVPILERIVGEKWPGELDVIREDTSSEATGYAWFDSSEREIVVSERLDAPTLYHELTHAWTNHDTTDERWINEGLTEVIAARVARETGVKEEPRKTPRRKGPGAFPLTEWGAFSQTNRGTDLYGYAAAYTAVAAMLEDLDDDQFSALVRDLYLGRTAYDGPEEEGYQGGGAVWGTFLDLAVKHGADQNIDRELKTWVLTRGQAKQLAAAKKAKAAYDVIDEADGEWLPPKGLREAMAYWKFQDAATIRDLAGDAAEEAGEFQIAAADAGLPASTAMKAAYETANVASEYGDVAAALAKAGMVTAEVGGVSAAVAGFDGPVTEVGELLLRLDSAAAEARDDLDAGSVEQAAATADVIAARSTWVLIAGIAAWLALISAAYGLFRLSRWIAVRVRARRRARREQRDPDGEAEDVEQAEVEIMA